MGCVGGQEQGAWKRPGLVNWLWELCYLMENIIRRNSCHPSCSKSLQWQTDRRTHAHCRPPRPLFPRSVPLRVWLAISSFRAPSLPLSCCPLTLSGSPALWHAQNLPDSLTREQILSLLLALLIHLWFLALFLLVSICWVFPTLTYSFSLLTGAYALTVSHPFLVLALSSFSFLPPLFNLSVTQCFLILDLSHIFSLSFSLPPWEKILLRGKTASTSREENLLRNPKFLFIYFFQTVP